MRRTRSASAASSSDAENISRGTPSVNNTEITIPQCTSATDSSTLHHPAAGPLQMRARRLVKQRPGQQPQDQSNSSTSASGQQQHHHHHQKTNRKRLITARTLQAIITLVNIIFLAASPVLVRSITNTGSSVSSSSSSSISGSSSISSSSSEGNNKTATGSSSELVDYSTGQPSANFISSMAVHVIGLLACALFFAVLLWPRWFSVGSHRLRRQQSRPTTNVQVSETLTQSTSNDALVQLGEEEQSSFTAPGPQPRQPNASRPSSGAYFPKWLLAEIFTNFAMLTAELVVFIQWFLRPVCPGTSSLGSGEIISSGDMEDQKCFAVVSTVKGLAWLEIFTWIVVLGFSLERYKSWAWLQEFILQ